MRGALIKGFLRKKRPVFAASGLATMLRQKLFIIVGTQGGGRGGGYCGKAGAGKGIGCGQGEVSVGVHFAAGRLAWTFGCVGGGCVGAGLGGQGLYGVGTHGGAMYGAGAGTVEVQQLGAQLETH